VTVAIPAYDEAMRRSAHEVVDALFDHIQNVASRKVVDWTPAAELRERVRITDGGGDLLANIRPLLDSAIQLHHPSYMGHQVCPPFPAAAIADFVISSLNQSTAVWEMSPLATVIEQEVVRWLADRAGYPAEALGTAVSGGSAANLTGLMAARARWNAEHGETSKRPLVLCSADAHYSVARAASIMGIPIGDVVKIATDAEHRLDVAALADALDAIAARDDAGVLAIVATAGSTATGAFDSLRAIAELRDRHRTWLHVDAAHGASVLLSDRLRHLVDGLERADSFAWDPHKMLWMPLSFGVILVRDGMWLRRAFEADAPYLFNAERASDNLAEMTIQCSRRADAVKLWITLQTAGSAAIGAALDHVTAVTRHLYDCVRGADDFVALHEPHFNIFCFRHRSDDATNARMREELLRSGDAWITTTLLKGERVLRVTIINPATSPADVERMLASLRAIV
jgi:L-2,4-diaminobutyrate decarboxylase